jgi:hypothetical protein
MYRLIVAVCLVLAAPALSACTYNRDGPPGAHFSQFKATAPEGNTAIVCHAYTCKQQTRVNFAPSAIAEVSKLMKKTMKDDSAAEERRAVAYAIAWFETYVGNKIGTSTDRPGMEYNGPGDPTQQDCVDEATNTTSYLMILERNDLLKHHKVGTPFSKENLLRGISGWPHWTAVLNEEGTGQRWAVDSWIYVNGENPAIVEAEKWYIEDLDSLPKPLS